MNFIRELEKFFRRGREGLRQQVSERLDNGETSVCDICLNSSNGNRRYFENRSGTYKLIAGCIEIKTSITGKYLNQLLFAFFRLPTSTIMENESLKHLISDNISSSHYYRSSEIRFNVLDLFCIMFSTMIIIIGTVGNAYVVYIFGIKTRTQRFEYFLVLLAIVDLISSFLVPTSFLYLTITGFKRWHFGISGCKIIPSLLQISVSVSQGVLLLISFERYHTLKKPFSMRLSGVKIIIWLICVLAVSILIVYPYITTLKVREDRFTGINTCVPDGSQYKTLLLSALIQLSRDIIALSLMLTFGYIIQKTLTKQHKNLTWDRNRFSEKGRKLLRNVIIAFAILTLPVDIFQCFFYAMIYAQIKFSPQAFSVILVSNTLLNLLQISNSVVNVFIYSRVHNAIKIPCLSKPKRRSRNRSTFYKTETDFVPVSFQEIGNLNMSENSDSIPSSPEEDLKVLGSYGSDVGSNLLPSNYEEILISLRKEHAL